MKKKSDPSDDILELLQTKNRPYSANNIVDEMKGAHTKTSIQKSLDDLSARGKITCKISGKTKLYFQNQDSLPVASSEELETLDTHLEALTDESSALRERLTELRQRRDQLLATEPIDELRNSRKQIEIDVEQAQEHQKQLIEEAQGLTPDDSIKIQKEYQLRCEQWFKRKAKCIEILDTLGDGIGKKRKDLIEELDLETDETTGVKITRVNRAYTIDEGIT